MNVVEHTIPLDEFAQVVKQLAAVAADITHIEEAKAIAASEKHHDKIADYLKEEQVHILKLRGLEQKRGRFAESLGWKDLTFRQILEQAADQEKELLSPLFTELDIQLRQLASARESSDRMIRIRLKEFSTALSRDGAAGYDETGSTTNAFAPHFHDRYV